MKNFLIVLALLLSFSLPAFAAEKESVHDRVMRTQTIRCGYGIWAPIFMKDSNTGAMSGIFHDYMEALAKNLSLKVEWTEETDWTSFGQALESGRIDGFCFAIWATGGRSREMDFTTPIYYVPFNAYVRIDDKRFDNNLAAINNKNIIIGTLDGEASNIIAANDYPEAKTLSAPQVQGQIGPLLNLASKKVDVIFTDPDTAQDYMKHNPGKIRLVPGGSGLRVFGNTVAVKKDEYAFKAMLDNGTRDLIQSGAIEKILKKYEKYPNTMYRVAKPYHDSAAQ